MNSMLTRSERTGVSNTAIVVLVIIVLMGAFLYVESQVPRKQEPARLLISSSFPPSISANANGVASIQVTNQGGDATGITVQVSSSGFTGNSAPFSLGPNQSETISLVVLTKNVQTGRYYGIVQAQYTDVTGKQATSPIQVSTYVIQPLTITNIGWLVDLFHPFGKNSIGTTDSTALHFQVQNEGPFLSNGMEVVVSSNVTAPGMTFTPSTVAVGNLGPQGTSSQLSFNISTDNSPPGRYAIFLTVLSVDNYQLYDTYVWLTVVS